MKKLLLLLAAACCIASCAEIRTTYIGKAYPTTGTAPELYFDWKDVPSDYVFTTNRLLATFIKYKTQTN